MRASRSTRRKCVLAGAQQAMAGRTTPQRNAVHEFVLNCLLIIYIAKVAVVGAAMPSAAAGQAPSCAAMYSNADTPLLFGGVHGGCTGRGCQPREDRWGKMCNPDKQGTSDIQGHVICKAQQTTAVLERLKKEPDSDSMLSFTPCMLYSYLKGRTLWVMGDSLMRNYYYALRCFMLDFWDHAKGECALNPETSVQRMIFKAADTNISSSQGSRAMIDMPRCIYLLDGGRICWVQSVRGEEYAATDEQNPGLLQVLQHVEAKSNDIFFLNFGRWHYTNCYGLQERPYRQALNELGALYQRTKAEFPNVIYKTIAADHTACMPTAVLVKDQCLPLGQGSYPPTLGEGVVRAAEQILGRYGVPVLETYNVTKDLHLAHILLPKGGVKECTHYCLSGVPEWEIWSMYKTFRRIGITPLTPQAAVQGHPACAPVADIRPPPGWSVNWDEANLGNKSRHVDSMLFG